MRAALFFAAALLALPARARAEDYWSAAATDPDAEVARRNYEKEMQQGDEFALLASQQTTNIRDVKRLLRLSLTAYENASLARPDAAEPHYRAGLILRDFFVGCSPSIVICVPGHARPELAAQMAAHWTAFETLAPLDPRVDFSFLFDRAIAHTHAAGDGGSGAEAHIEAALVDYQAALRRVNLTGFNEKELYGNMAETLMMLGRLDEAIAMYQETLRYSGDSSTMYGLAVALDRDEQGAKAREIIVALGASEFDTFKENVRAGKTFFVPEGEEYYYLALAEEALGDTDNAILDWQHFIATKAHPIFDARAAANRDALQKAHKRGHAPAATPAATEHDR